MPKCTGLEPGETITMYEKCGLRVKAAEEAVKLRDAAAYERLLEAAGGGIRLRGRRLRGLAGRRLRSNEG